MRHLFCAFGSHVGCWSINVCVCEVDIRTIIEGTNMEDGIDANV